MFDFLVEFFDKFIVLVLGLGDLLSEIFFLFLKSKILFGIDLIILLKFEFLVFSKDNFGPEFSE